MIPVEVVESLLCTEVNDIEIYKKAFTHKSAVQHDGAEGSYETLEFMGDSVLGFIVTKFLYDKYEHLQEGFSQEQGLRLFAERRFLKYQENWVSIIGLSWTIRE